MAHYGFSPEEDVLRGEEHPLSSRANRPDSVADRIPPVRARLAQIDREEKERLVRAFGRRAPTAEAAIVAVAPPPDKPAGGGLVPDVFKGGMAFAPGWKAKVDLGSRNMIKFTRAF